MTFNFVIYGPSVVIEQHPIQMRVVPDMGSRVHPAHKTSPRYPRAQLSRRTILYIGSDQECRIMLSRIVRGMENSQLVVADSGREGRLSAFARDPNLILVDARLPDCDGESLIAYFRSSVHRLMTPVAVLSGDENDRLRFIRAGAVAWMAKPLRVTDVERSMQGLLDIYSLR